MSTSILSYRALCPEDAEAFKALRLCGLKEHPEAFLESDEAWSVKTLEEIAERITQNNDMRKGFIMGCFDGEFLVGVLGYFQFVPLKVRHKGQFWGMYVDKAYRRQGIAGQLLDVCIQKAREAPEVRLLHIEATTSNIPALRLYEAKGFESYGLQKEALFANNQFYDESHLVLFLK